MKVRVSNESKTTTTQLYLSFQQLKATKSGFSLLEILVALTLVSLLFLAIDFFPSSDREQVAKTIDYIERSVRFSSNETVLRSSVIRMRFELSADPQKISIEYGPDGDFVLPSLDRFGEESKLTLRDQEKRDLAIQELNKNFNSITEFQDSPQTIPVRVRILGIGSNLRNGLISEGEAHIYFYPSGEKDAAIIILGSSKEMVTLTLSPFTNEIKRTYKTLEILESQLLEDILQDEADKLYEDWVKNES